MRVLHDAGTGPRADADGDGSGGGDGEGGGEEEGEGEDVSGGRRPLADRVWLADGPLAQARGLMFRTAFPTGRALAMPFGRARTRGLHSLFVYHAFDAIWVVDGRVTRVKRFRPFRSLGWARADLVVEVPAGVAADVAVGDAVWLEREADGRAERAGAASHGG